MTRHDLYGTIHKAIRAALFEGAARVARTDFARREEALAAAAGTRRMLRFLHGHAAHEEEEILPALERHAPELSSALHDQHSRIEGLEREIEGLLARLGEAFEAERASLGLRLHQRLGRLVAEHLLHMEVEEQQASRILWAHLTDEELVAIEGRIVGAIPPAELAEWLALMLPALSVPEGAETLVGLAGAVPPGLFEELVAPARRALDPARWAALARAAELVALPGGLS
jgi:hypothetical protein